MNKLLKWFKDMLDAELSVSSKRFCGVLGFFSAIFVLIWCTVTNTQAPTAIETMLLQNYLELINLVILLKVEDENDFA